jgi:hypothetical protein
MPGGPLTTRDAAPRPARQSQGVGDLWQAGLLARIALAMLVACWLLLRRGMTRAQAAESSRGRNGPGPTGWRRETAAA